MPWSYVYAYLRTFDLELRKVKLKSCSSPELCIWLCKPAQHDTILLDNCKLIPTQCIWLCPVLVQYTQRCQLGVSDCIQLFFIAPARRHFLTNCFRPTKTTTTTNGNIMTRNNEENMYSKVFFVLVPATCNARNSQPNDSESCIVDYIGMDRKKQHTSTRPSNPTTCAYSNLNEITKSRYIL